MKRLLCITLVTLLLAGCAAQPTPPVESSTADTTTVASVTTTTPSATETTLPPAAENTTTGSETAAPTVTDTTVGTASTAGTPTAATTTVTTTAPTTTTTAPTQAPSAKMKQLIVDPDAKAGFTIRGQKDHANNNAFKENIGTFCPTHTLDDPSWRLAQWDSGPCIWADRVESARNVLTDGIAKWMVYDKNEKSWLLRLNSEAYYQGKGAAKGDYWPHLILSQDMDFSRMTDEELFWYSGGVDRMIFNLDLRMPYYEHTPRNGDWVRAAQYLVYFVVRNRKDSPSNYIWFGLNLFDSRYEYNNSFYMMDVGAKGDSTGKPIYVIGMKEMYAGGKNTFWNDAGTSPQVTNEWTHFELDLVPHLEELCRLAVAKGYYSDDTTAADLYLTSFSLNWEIIGTFDCGIESKNFRVYSYVDEAQ